ncbi:MAG TPA: hydrolase [Clostridiaceae bacterium]|nr:hydrolase [Clostridiaceae bacterium]
MSETNRKFVPEVKSVLKDDSIIVTPSVIRNSSGIKIYNRRIKSFIFTTDVATITYSDADAILAVYPQTPHPAIIEAITAVASQPVFAGVGGGTTGGKRSAYVAEFAEARGAMGIVVNSPTTIATIRLLENSVECPIVATIVSHYDDVASKLNAGADILNVADGKNTSNLVRWIRKRYPKVPIIATGGPTDETIQEAIDAGANAISWTPPTNAELFKNKMVKYRIEKRQTFMDNHDGMTMNECENRNLEH